MIQLYLLCSFDPPNLGRLFAIFPKYKCLEIDDEIEENIK